MTIDQARELARMGNVQDAAAAFCFALGTSVAELSRRIEMAGQRRRLLMAGRKPELRAVVFSELSAVGRWSSPEIAAVFGTAHSTVLEAVKRHERNSRERMVTQ